MENDTASMLKKLVHIVHSALKNALFPRSEGTPKRMDAF
jgi:hypothetical protein